MKNALIIEDNSAMLRGLKDNFESKGYRVSTARDGREIEISTGQFKMLRLFLQRAECPLTRDEIRDAVWGYSHFVTCRDIDRIVTTLRNKIEPDPENPAFIHTVKDIGYKFEQPHGNDSDN